MLRKIFALSLVVGLLGLTTGCPSKDKTKKTEAKTGVKTGNGTGKTEQKTASLELTPPDDVSIKQNGTEKVTVKVTRKNTTEVVTVEFKDLPEGVSVKEAEKKILGDKEEGTFTLQAEATAKPIKDKVAKVKITDATGKLTQEAPFKVSVTESKEAKEKKDK